MYIVALAWMFVVLLMSAAEAVSPQGSVLGALVTLLLYGVMPLSIVLYILGTPARKRALRAREAASAAQPDGGSQAAGDAVAAEREKA
jgi:membrane protein implicated in regulation of membrane protease activity